MEHEKLRDEELNEPEAALAGVAAAPERGRSRPAAVPVCQLVGFAISELTLLVLIAAAILYPRAVHAQAATGGSKFADEPSARKLYGQMIEAFHDAETLSFVSEHQRGTIGQEKSICTFRAWLKKPNYFRLEARSSDGKLAGVLVGDGGTLWIHWPNGRPRWPLLKESPEDEKTRFNSYMAKPAPPGKHSIWHEALYLGGGMSFPVFELSTFHGCIDPLSKDIDAVRRIGTETIDGEPCDGIQVSLLDGQRHWYFWLSRRDHFPRKLKEIVKVADDRFAVEQWSSLTINKPIPDGHFRWQPPAGWVEWRLPDAEDALLAAGTKAPDFELAAVDGDRIKLSDYRGRTVWLCFWRLGCPPCRKETPLLQALYEKHKDDGFVVLGVNVSDDRQLVLEYLRKQGVTFPSIIDTSDEACRVCHEDYQGGGVPLNYLIDGDGNVVDAAFEYAPLRAALTSLRPEFAGSP